MLELKNITKVVGADTHIHPTDLVLERGSLNVLLGPTLSGKTSLMRLMAGLDKPTTGTITFDGKDVTGVRVQDRSVAMVYQQFINYPAMTVYENIASPMRISGKDAATIDREVRKAAELMKLTPYLERHAAQPVGRPAAAHGAGARHSQECQPRPARRAARQSRLQAARGTARGIAETVCRRRFDLRLCNDRAAGSAAARRPYRNDAPGAHQPVRADDLGLSQAGRYRRRENICRSAAQYARRGEVRQFIRAWRAQRPAGARTS